MKLRRIRSQTDLKAYQLKTEESLAVNFPIEYLERARVFVLKTPDGSIHGGFFYVSRGPLRTVVSLPRDLSLPNRLTELTGLWLSPNVKQRRDVFSFWIGLAWAAVPEMRNRVIFAYDFHKRGLARMYALARPVEIYRGRVPKLNGMLEEGIESINLISGLRVCLLPLLCAKFFISRLFQARRFHEPIEISFFKA